MIAARFNVGETWKYNRGTATAKIQSIDFDTSYNDYVISYEWQFPIKSDNNKISSTMFLRNFERVK